MNDRVLVPTNIPKGRCRLVITLRDRIAGAKAVAWREFLVR